jgi:hypothetical protein
MLFYSLFLFFSIILVLLPLFVYIRANNMQPTRRAEKTQSRGGAESSKT